LEANVELAMTWILSFFISFLQSSYTIQKAYETEINHRARVDALGVEIRRRGGNLGGREVGYPGHGFSGVIGGHHPSHALKLTNVRFCSNNVISYRR
jgi:hypothetical protein